METLVGVKNLKNKIFSFLNIVPVKGKLIIIVFGILCISFLTLGVVSYNIISDALTEAKGIEMEQLLSIAINAMDKELDFMQALNDTVKSSPEVQRYMRSGVAGQEVFDFVNYVARQNDFIENIMIADASGEVKIVNDPNIVGINIRDREYFVQSQTGIANISEIKVSRLTGNHVFIFAEPLFFPDFKGIVAITINYDTFFNQNLGEINLGQTGYFWGIDREGLAILHPNPKIAHKLNIFEIENADGLHDVAKKMIQGESGCSTYYYNGIERYAVFAPAGNWYLAITIDTAEIMATAYRVRSIFTVAGILSLVIAGLLINILVTKEEKIRVSEERYRLLIENANEAIIVTQDGWNVYANPKALQIFARSDKEIKTTPFMDFIHPLERDEIKQRYLKAMRGDVPQEKCSMRIVAGDGSVKWTEVNAVVIEWERKPASLILLSDITDRRHAEQKINAYTAELELKGNELEELYRQLAEQFDKARYIHERTLPFEIPQLEKISLATHYQPAMRLGGDYYNTIRTGNKLVFYLSDVSGHGMEGVILSMFTKEAINSYLSLKPAEIHPEKILHHLNRQYRRENYPDDYFICIFLAVLDFKTMELSYTSAGFQEAPLVQTGSGERMLLANEGLPISGAIPENIVNFTAEKITLTPGTTVLIATDGLAEHDVGDTRYGSKLEEVFYAHAHLPPEVIVRAINDDFSRFNNGSLQGHDDITIGIIQVDPALKKVYQLELESSMGINRFCASKLSFKGGDSM